MTMALAVLSNQHLSLATLGQLSEARERQVLGAICYFAAPLTEPAAPRIDAPMIWVSMPPLAEMKSTPSGQADTMAAPADPVCDVWFSGSVLEQGQRGDIRYRHDGNSLFGVIELAESAPEAGSTSTPLQHTTERAYRQIFELLEALEYPYLFRLWNYMADINGQSHELERYRQFNLGRQEAFIACQRDVVGNVPAACALGAVSGPLTIAFLAGRQSPLAIENPRQISAFAYPDHYGPRSPTFARASLVRLGSEAVLFVSGTASIVGHRTVHPGDVQAQTRETLTNIETIVQVANQQVAKPLFSLRNLLYRVYVRHSADLAAIRNVMQERMGPQFNAVFLQADVCRHDLLVEMEASASLPA
jgi:chorismate lyase/3-hydroxybenzoate synthase